MTNNDFNNRDLAFAAALEDARVSSLLTEVDGQVRRGHLSLAQVGGFSETELAGGYAAAVRFLEAGKPAKTLQIAGSLILVEPRRAAYHRIAGVALHHLKQYALADDYYRRALDLEPDDPTTLLYRGEVLLALGRTADGKVCLASGLARAAADPRLRGIVKRAREVARAYGVEAA